eukprot:m.875035 g.875035  ORF g.875035 m.875035 type:complete len:80 (-) comp23577_c0_seq38:2448-2687(-)
MRLFASVLFEEATSCPKNHLPMAGNGAKNMKFAAKNTRHEFLQHTRRSAETTADLRWGSWQHAIRVFGASNQYCTASQD